MKLHKRLLGLNTWLFLVKIKKLLKLGPSPGFYTKKKLNEQKKQKISEMGYGTNDTSRKNTCYNIRICSE